MVISRRVFNRPVPVIEWSFTIAAGLIALALAALLFSILEFHDFAAFRAPVALMLNSDRQSAIGNVQFQYRYVRWITYVISSLACGCP